MDPIKYMIGKFDLSDNYLNNLPCINDYDNNYISDSDSDYDYDYALNFIR